MDTKIANKTPDVIATDGCEVRVLCATSRGGMALFTLAPGMVARAVAHRTIEEIWVVIRGRGRMWRKAGEREDVVELAPGVSVSLPTGTHFQLRCDGDEPLEAVAVTMPPSPPEFAGLPGGGERRKGEPTMPVKALRRPTSGLTYAQFGGTPVQMLWRNDKLMDEGQTNAELVQKLGRLPLMFEPGTTW